MQVITSLNEVLSPEETLIFKHGLREYVNEEKVKHHLLAASTAKERQMYGARSVDGIGLKKLSVPVRTYLRWQQAYPGCWQDKQFVDEFYRDNPDCRAH